MQQLMRQQRINNIALTVGLSLILALHPWSGLTPTRAQVDPNATVPASFTDSLLITVDSATALTRTPDGRLLIASKGGELRVLPSGSSTPITALTLNSETCDDFERGLLGVTVDPNFAVNCMAQSLPLTRTPILPAQCAAVMQAHY